MEEWRQIEGWPGYEVSSEGRVRTYWGAAPWRFKDNTTGTGRGKRTLIPIPKVIGYKTNTGHRGVQLTRDGEKQRFGIHGLVLTAFVGPRPSGMFACHNNGKPADNRVENLRWDTPKANVIDTVMHGGNPRAISADKAAEVWQMLTTGHSVAAIVKALGVPKGAVSQIKCGGSWRHLTERLGGRVERVNQNLSPLFPRANALNATEEMWSDLPGLRGYRVSSCGRVQTAWVRVTGKGVGRGNVTVSDQWRDVRIFKDPDGYYRFGVCKAATGDKPKQVPVHRAVLLAFAGTPLDGHIACHADGVRTNNHVSNLRWDTWQANALDRHVA